MDESDLPYLALTVCTSCCWLKGGGRGSIDVCVGAVGTYLPGLGTYVGSMCVFDMYSTLPPYLPAPNPLVLRGASQARYPNADTATTKRVPPTHLTPRYLPWC